MPIKRTRYNVAFLDESKEIVEHEVEVWGVDILRGEREARRAGLKFSVVDQSKQQVIDLGDVRSREALELWAAVARTGLYKGDANKWRMEDYVGAEKVEEPTAVDPTPSAASTTAD